MSSGCSSRGRCYRPRFKSVAIAVDRFDASPRASGARPHIHVAYANGAARSHARPIGRQWSSYAPWRRMAA